MICVKLITIWYRYKLIMLIDCLEIRVNIESRHHVNSDWTDFIKCNMSNVFFTGHYCDLSIHHIRYYAKTEFFLYHNSQMVLVFFLVLQIALWPVSVIGTLLFHKLCRPTNSDTSTAFCLKSFVILLWRFFVAHPISISSASKVCKKIMRGDSIVYEGKPYTFVGNLKARPLSKVPSGRRNLFTHKLV